MQKYATINEDELNEFLEENRGGVDDAEFTDRYLNGVVTALKDNPKLYRSFGIYWWALKRLILKYKGEFNGLDDSYDSTLSDAFSFENDALTVCAAYNFQQIALENGYMYSNSHQATTEEVVDLVIEDANLERLIFAESFK